MKTLRFEKYEAVASAAAVIAVSLAMFVIATVVMDWWVMFR